MKRRTARTGALNADKHRRAFNHAYQVLKSVSATRTYQRTGTHNRRGQRICFWINLPHEDGSVCPIRFECTKGFRMAIKGVNFTGPQPTREKNIELRLHLYRRQITAWHSQYQKLPFRSFNLLLAAISWDIALESVSTHRD